MTDKIHVEKCYYCKKLIKCREKIKTSPVNCRHFESRLVQEQPDPEEPSAVQLDICILLQEGK